MEERPKITFNVSVFSKYGTLVDKFTVKAETKKDVTCLVVQQLKTQGVYDDVEYKIT